MNNTSFKVKSLLLVVIVSYTFFATAQERQFSRANEISSNVDLFSTNIIQQGNSLYMLALTDSLNQDQGLLVKMDVRTNAILWAKKIFIDGNLVQPVKLTLRKDGNIIIGANDWSNATGFGSQNILFLLLDKDGNVLWRKRIGSENFEGLRDFTIDQDQNIIFTGELFNGFGYDLLVGKLNLYGDYQSSRSYNFIEWNYPESIIFDGSNKYYIGGTTNASGLPDRKAFFVQMNEQLGIDISKELDDNTMNSEINAMVFDHEHKIHFFGQVGDIIHDFVFQGNLDKVEVNKYNQGEISNAWLADDKIYVHDFRTSYLAFLSNKEINVVGWYGDPQPDFITFDLINNQVSGCNHTRSSIGDWRISIVSHSINYNSDCAYYPSEEKIGDEIQADFINIDFTEREAPLSSAIAEDIVIQNKDLLLNLHCESIDTTNAVERLDDSSMLLFPNPATDKIYIDIPQDQNYLILDYMGKYVKEGIICHDGIDISHQMPGLYFLKIGDAFMRFIKF